MGKLSLFLLIMVLVCIEPDGTAQTPMHLSDPTIALRDHIIHITYDILNGIPTDSYSVYINITDAEGRKINAATLTGDIGKEVTGGLHKNIQWDLEADQIFMNEKIYFEIFARATLLSESAMTGSENNSHETATEEHLVFVNSNPAPTTHAKSYNRAAIVLQSLAIPGLGLSRMTGFPHWLRGLAGYGCLTGSFILNSQSMMTYDGIGDYEDFNDKHAQLQKSITQDNISEILAYTAVGIWITDFIWTLAGTSKYNKSAMAGEAKGISFRPVVDPLTFAPMVGISYRF